MKITVWYWFGIFLNEHRLTSLKKLPNKLGLLQLKSRFHTKTIKFLKLKKKIVWIKVNIQQVWSILIQTGPAKLHDS